MVCSAVGRPPNEEMIKMPCQAFLKERGGEREGEGKGKRNEVQINTDSPSLRWPQQESLGKMAIYLSEKCIHNYS